MKCATGKIDITPDLHTQLSGDLGIRRYGERVLEPLFARIMILEDSSQHRICIISMDLTIAAEEPCQRIRNAAADIIGTAADAVMVHVVQNHTAPAIGHFFLDESIPIPPEHEWMLGGETAYTEMVIERIIAALPGIYQRLEDAEMISGRSVEGRYTFNRRGVDNFNRIFMPGPAWDSSVDRNMRGVEGPIDPEVSIIAFRNKKGHTLGMLLSHACHPVCAFPARVISGDWPGIWSEVMEKSQPGSYAALVINGCCGNLNPWSDLNPDYQCDHVKMGHALAAAAQKALAAGTPAGDDADLAVASAVLPLEFRMPETAELGDAVERYAGHPQIDWEIPGKKVKYDWFIAANNVGTVNQIKRRGHLDYEIQVFRIGNNAIVGLPGEPFVEGQLALKLAFPEHLLMPAHCVNQYVGYIPVKKSFQHPICFRGHEGNFSSWSKLEPDALQKIITAAREIAASSGLKENKEYIHEL